MSLMNGLHVELMPIIHEGQFQWPRANQWVNNTWFDLTECYEGPGITTSHQEVWMSVATWRDLTVGVHVFSRRKFRRTYRRHFNSMATIVRRGHRTRGVATALWTRGVFRYFTYPIFVTTTTKPGTRFIESLMPAYEKRIKHDPWS